MSHRGFPFSRHTTRLLLVMLFAVVAAGVKSRPAIERVSVDSAGSEASGGSHSPRISASGRFVAFASQASNLAPGDGNGETDVFVRDRKR